MKRDGKKIVWTDRAESELAQTLRYLTENFSNREVSRLAENIESTLKIIIAHPKLFPASIKRKNVRRVVILRFNTMYYRVRRDKIEILSFFSNRQDPKKNKFL